MAQCLPFAQASSRQITRALLSVQETLEDMFHPLSWEMWTNAFLTLQPDLWVAQDTVCLDEQGFARVAKHLATSSGAADSEAMETAPRTVYMAKKLLSYQDDAIYALAEIEAQPLVYGPGVYQLITSLAMGNAVADAVYQATPPGPWDSYGGPGAWKHPGGLDPAPARAGVYARLQALARARGAQGITSFPARPAGRNGRVRAAPGPARGR